MDANANQQRRRRRDVNRRERHKAYPVDIEKLIRPIHPIADDALTKEIFDVIIEARSMDLAHENVDYVKKGNDEVTRHMRRGKAKFVVIAADTVPIKIVMHLVLLGEEKEIPWVFVRQQSKLGEVCDIPGSDVSACSVGLGGEGAFCEKIRDVCHKIWECHQEPPPTTSSEEVLPQQMS